MMSKPGPRPKRQQQFEYRVRYRRRWWPHDVTRIYQWRGSADRLAVKLRTRYPGLQPVEELRIERRRVGEWEPIEET